MTASGKSSTKTLANVSHDLRIKQGVSRSLAADLIEIAIRSPFREQFSWLAKVDESGLLESDKILADTVQRLTQCANDLDRRIINRFPLSHLGQGRGLLDAVKTLDQEIDLYRQEQFWTQPDRGSLIAAEDLISEIYSHYKALVEIVARIDVTDEDSIHNRKCIGPSHTANPYASI